MTKICFGGTFNPIHHGHLLCARAAAEAVGADTVVLIPTGRAPHKPRQPDIAPTAERLEMCRLAIDGVRGFELDDRETRRSGPSYTIQTVRDLKLQGWPEVRWLIGADMLNSLPTWHEAEALLKEVNWIVMARPGWAMDWQSLGPSMQALRKNVVQVRQVDISATEIRRRTALGLSIDYLTPPAVCRYIRQAGLYLS